MKNLLALIICGIASSSAAAATDSHISAAKALVEAAQAERMIDTIQSQLDTMFQGMGKEEGLNEMQQEILENYKNQMMNLAKEATSWEKMEPFMVGVYVKHFTEDELNSLVDFYRSPIGQQYLKKMPDVLAESSTYMQQAMQELMPRLTVMQRQLVQELQNADQGEQ